MLMLTFMLVLVLILKRAYAYAHPDTHTVPLLPQHTPIILGSVLANVKPCKHRDTKLKMM